MVVQPHVARGSGGRGHLRPSDPPLRPAADGVLTTYEVAKIEPGQVHTGGRCGTACEGWSGLSLNVAGPRLTILLGDPPLVSPCAWIVVKAREVGVDIRHERSRMRRWGDGAPDFGKRADRLACADEGTAQRCAEARVAASMTQCPLAVGHGGEAAIAWPEDLRGVAPTSPHAPGATARHSCTPAYGRCTSDERRHGQHSVGPRHSRERGFGASPGDSRRGLE